MVPRAIFIFVYLVALEGIRAQIVPQQISCTDYSSQVDLQFDENSVTFQNISDLSLDWDQSGFEGKHNASETCKLC